MNREQVLAALASGQEEMRRQFGVESLAIFGSAARDELRPDSDVDILVEFGPNTHVGLFGFVRLQRYLETLLSRKVDLVTPNALKRQLKDQILAELVRAA